MTDLHSFEQCKFKGGIPSFLCFTRSSDQPTQDGLEHLTWSHPILPAYSMFPNEQSHLLMQPFLNTRTLVPWCIIVQTGSLVDTTPPEEACSLIVTKLSEHAHCLALYVQISSLIGTVLFHSQWYPWLLFIYCLVLAVRILFCSINCIRVRNGLPLCLLYILEH